MIFEMDFEILKKVKTNLIIYLVGEERGGGRFNAKSEGVKNFHY
jgi:hypothetical protein